MPTVQDILGTKSNVVHCIDPGATVLEAIHKMNQHKLGALVVMAWLLAISANLLLAGYYDIAVRDIAMAFGAWSLSRLWQPATQAA